MPRNRLSKSILTAAVCVAVGLAPAAPPAAAPEKPGASAPGPSKIVYPGPDGKLVYTPDAQGNTIPDFSNCGYRGGGVALPHVPTRLTIEPVPGDNRQHVQKAIDQLAAMPPDADGFRGALLLKKGAYPLSDTIRVTTSGIVLRGEGQGDDGTVLVATKRAKHTLVDIVGAGKRQYAPDHPIADDYVPVGARRFRIENPHGLTVGDDVEIVRPSTEQWIADIGMDKLRETYKIATVVNWKPGAFDLNFTRRIAAIRGNEIEIDAPLACALEKKYGGGRLRKFTQPGLLSLCGVENLRGDSVFDPSIRDPKRKDEYADENHAWNFISLRNAENSWVRDCTAIHFAYSMVSVAAGTRWTTVQDCRSLQPVSLVTGGRRYTFAISGSAALALFQRCRAERGRHDYVMHARVPGPHVFLDSVAVNAFSDSGPHHRWAVGTLYDALAIRGNSLNVQDRGPSGTGHGWAGAAQVFWNCEANSFIAQKPPTAQNWAIGCIGEKKPGRAGRLDGYWESHGAHVQPRSLYLKQLEDRLGPQAVRNVTTEAQRNGTIRDEMLGK